MGSLPVDRGDRGDRGDSGEDEKAGMEGLLRLAWVRRAGSEGPGRGVMRESSESSEVGRDCDSDAVELETGEQGRGAMISRDLAIEGSGGSQKAYIGELVDRGHGRYCT